MWGSLGPGQHPLVFDPTSPHRVPILVQDKWLGICRKLLAQLCLLACQSSLCFLYLAQVVGLCCLVLAGTRSIPASGFAIQAKEKEESGGKDCKGFSKKQVQHRSLICNPSLSTIRHLHEVRWFAAWWAWEQTTCLSSLSH